MKITYWSDYACPYCYIGEERMKIAIKELGLENLVEIEARAFELDPDAPQDVQTTIVVRFAKKYRLTEPQAAEQIESISALGRELGIDFRYAATLYTNTRAAHRLYKFALQQKGSAVANKLGDLLFDAYFTKNEKLAEHATLLRVAKEVGLDEGQTRTLLESNQYDDEVRFDEREAMLYGIHGVPYFLINGKLAIPGAVSVKAMKHLLERALKEEQENAVGEEAHQCGSEGCRI